MLSGSIVGVEKKKVPAGKDQMVETEQVNLLTEQKVTKLIHLIEELRRDMPMVRDRHDPQSKALQERTDPLKVLSAIEERGLTADKGT